MSEQLRSYAKIILDSITPQGDRLTTMEVCFHRFVLAEVNTHRVFCLAADSVLEFDLPGGSRGRRRVFTMPISEFVDKWHHGAAPRKSKPRADGSQGENRQPIRDRLAAMRIRQLNEVTGLVQTSTVTDAIFSGVKSVYEVRAGKHTIAGSRDHRIYTPHGWRTIGDLNPGDEIVVRRFGKRDEDVLDPTRLKKIGGVWRSQWQRQKRSELLALHGGCTKCDSTIDLHVHHLVPVHVDPTLAFVDENVTLLCEPCHHAQHSTQGWQGGTYLYGDTVVVSEVVYRGEEMTYDIEVAGEYPNFVANGVVVHNSRNSASSRAIPVSGQLERVRGNPATPVAWPEEKPGMQGGAELQGADLWVAQALVERLGTLAAGEVSTYVTEHEGQPRLHKSVLNRYLEPFMWHTAVITSTAWENYFALRTDVAAQPEIKAAADLMQAAYRDSTPALVQPGDGFRSWHMPYLDYETIEEVKEDAWTLARISAARCARVSYLTQDGVRDFRKDMELFDRLTDNVPMHASPLEHVARPEPRNREWTTVYTTDPNDETSLLLPRYGNLLGWHQLRFDVEASARYRAFA